MGDRDSTADAGGSLPSPPPRRRTPVFGEGDWIGRYQIVRLLGRGGMGMVYEAVQEHPRRRVALKIMDPSLASPGALRRFDTEAQLLGRLDHEGIARIYEAGTHREPRIDIEPVPFYAMEYIADARPVTEYAAARGLDVPARLRLMAALCDAVEHGHREGVLHRDLKPENVVVDGQGRVKVIDFGIARVTEPELAATRVTEVGQLVGTLQYMSPEQFDGYSDRLDARSDVYALGVILYELVCGRLPYDVTGKTVIQAAHVVRETEPPPPGRVDPRLKGDVETIILKAMHKDPARRYPSAAELGADLVRCLESEPIEARRDSRGYLARKRTVRWVGRNPEQAVAAVIVLALAGMFFLFERERLFRTALADGRLMGWYFSGPPPAPMAGPMDHVRVILFDQATRFDLLAEESGIAPVSREGRTENASHPEWRAVHGLMMKKLAPAGPAAVLWDLTFKSAGPRDEEFIAGIEALNAANIDVLSTRDVSTPGASKLDEALEGRMLSGPALMDLIATSGRAGAPDVWCYELARQPANGATVTSAPLQAYGVARHPRTVPTADFGRRPDEIWLRYNRREVVAPGVEPAPAAPAEQIRVTSVEPGSPELPLHAEPSGLPSDPAPAVDPEAVESGRLADEAASLSLGATFLLHMPPDPVIEAATLRYEEVFRMTPERRAAELAGKIIVLGHLRPGDVRIYTDGRPISGTYAVAATAEHLSRGVRIQAITAGRRVWALVLFGAIGVAAGVASGPSLPRALAIIVLLVAISALVSWGAYRWLAVFFNPLVPALGLATCALLAWFVMTVHRRHRAGRAGSRA